MKGYKNSPVRAVPGENKQYSSHLCVFFKYKLARIGSSPPSPCKRLSGYRRMDGERKKVKKLGKAKKKL